MSDPRHDPTDPRSDRTRQWSSAHIVLVILAMLAGFVMAGMVFWLMSGAFTDPPPPATDSAVEEPAAAP